MSFVVDLFSYLSFIIGSVSILSIFYFFVTDKNSEASLDKFTKGKFLNEDEIVSFSKIKSSAILAFACFSIWVILLMFI